MFVDAQALFRTQLLKQSSVVITVAQPVSSKYPRSYIKVSAHSGIKVAHDEDLICCVDFTWEVPQLRVEGFFCSRVCLECSSIDTDEGVT